MSQSRARPRQSSFNSSAVIPGPIKSSIGLCSKNWATRYKRRLLKPKPLSTIAKTAWPKETRACAWSSRRSKKSTRPICLSDSGHNPQMVQPLHGQTRHADSLLDELVRVSHAVWAPVKLIPSKIALLSKRTYGRWVTRFHQHVIISSQFFVQQIVVISEAWKLIIAGQRVGW